MVTSFVWGTVVFDEKPHSPLLAVVALMALVVGVGGVAASQALEMRAAKPMAAQDEAAAVAKLALNIDVQPAHVEMAAATGERPQQAGQAAQALASVPEQNDALSESAETSAAHPAVSTLATGIICAVFTGICDGSLMAPFSWFRRSESAAGLTPEEAALEYLSSFALGLPLVALPPLLLTCGFRALATCHDVAPSGIAATTTHSSWHDSLRALRAVAIPGVCCGGEAIRIRTQRSRVHRHWTTFTVVL